jgi:UDP-2,3-diacylglucosamine pyrophosphatase LpxH
MSTTPSSSLLIVSDLHLGSALRPPMRYASLKMIVRLDRAFERFLEYHQNNPAYDYEGNRIPWMLVFNGDTIDFLHMGLTPEEQMRLEAEEALYGLSFARRRSRWKLQEIARYHRKAFKALCRFLEAGNQCVFVVGNHDADLWFEKVRRDLKGAIARHAHKPKSVKSLIHFAPWFYYEEGRIYVEHGHRFDPYCTFPDPLAPIDHNTQSLEPTFGHWGLRYFCNPVPTFPIHDLESWGALDFLRWAFNRAGVGIIHLVWFYIRFLLRYLSDTAQARLAAKVSPSTKRKLRRKRLRRYARKAKISLKRIRALDALRKAHVGASLIRLSQAVYLDRLLLIILSVIAIIVWSQYASRWLWALGLIIGLGITSFLWILLVQLRPTQNTHPLLGDIAQQIGDITGVPLVVFGHTHHPTLEEHQDTQWLNPGTWEHLARTPKHKPDEPCTCSAKFAVVKGEGNDMEVGLYQWCTIRKDSELLLSSNDLNQETNIKHNILDH